MTTRTSTARRANSRFTPAMSGHNPGSGRHRFAASASPALDPWRQGTINCAAQPSTARAWNEQMLAASAVTRPGRQSMPAICSMVSAAMYDAWAALPLPAADQVLHAESASAADPQSAQAEAISFGRRFDCSIIVLRFPPGAPISLPDLQTCMTQLGHDPGFTDTTGNTTGSARQPDCRNPGCSRPG